MRLATATIFCWCFTLATAFAHDSWINHNGLTDPVTTDWCCNEGDCEMLPVDGVELVPGGYFLRLTGETIPSVRVLWRSPDGRWWRCRYTNPNQIETYLKTRCLIGPPPAM